jgi:integrase
MAKRKKRRGIEYREDRQRWGYRVCLQGVTYKRYVWATPAEAREALNNLKDEIRNKPREPDLPPTALITVVSAYLIDSAEKGRSQWRIDGMRWNFDKVIIPFLGAATPIASITTEQVQKMVIQRKRTVKPKTIWHDVTNLRALFNWACEPKGKDKKKLVSENPVDGLDTSIIGSTKSKKAPLNLAMVDQAAAAIVNPGDRAYFDFLRFTGLRKDEANRLRWEDINFDEGYFHCRGTKTDEADAYLPLAPALMGSLKKHKATSTSEYVFAGRSAQTRGKKIYSRRRMFERIEKVTAVEKYQKEHPEVSQKQALEACKKENFRGGVHLKPKDLRDYFASTVQTDDPRVLMSLMRHTNLTTTTKYLRAMHERMKEAVSGLGANPDKSLGATLGATQNSLPGQKSVENDIQVKMAELARMLTKRGNFEGLFGGGGQTRTVDSADMSRVL